MVIVLIGPMGCGKTTIGTLLAARLDCRFADGDDYHPQGNVTKMSAGIPLTDDDRLPWLAILAEMIRASIRRKEKMVLACSALKRTYRQILGIDQQQIFSVYLRGSRELLAERIGHRQHPYMNKGLLDSQLATLEVPRDGLIVDIAQSPERIVNDILAQLSTNSQQQM